MSHTPGPWTASQYLDNGEWGVLNNANIIVVGVASRISEEDAALIAAAPVLLGALKECVENFNISRLVMDGEPRALAGLLVDKYRKVIAKAEGRSQ